MRILISNDDGIQSPGLHALVDAMQGIGEVWVVAPDREQSAVGHAITLSDPIRLIPWEEVHGADHTYAISGTPADCVKLALTELMPARPDLVVSGINRGENTGISIIYSGTVSAATEGTINGIPSVAISLDSFLSPDFKSAATIAQRVVHLVMERGLPEDTLLNVNIPNLSLDKIKGFRVARQGRARFQETFMKRADPRGKIYYWMDGAKVALTERNTDGTALHEGYVTLTPIRLNFTHEGFMREMESWPLEFRAEAKL
jgi:5'-nucleotidase